MKRCWFFHVWPKWRDIERGPVAVARRDGTRAEVGSFVVQQRICEVCGRVELRIERALL